MGGLLPVVGVAGVVGVVRVLVAVVALVVVVAVVVMAVVVAVEVPVVMAVVVAVPVAPYDTVASLRKLADRVVCPLTPAPFYSIGQWYEDFSQVSDEDVTRMLERAWNELDARTHP